MTRSPVSATSRPVKSRFTVRHLVNLGLLAAMGVVLVMFVEVPLFPSAAHLKYDPADVPILIGTMMYGPVSGFLLTLVVSFIQSFFIHGSSGPVGFFMHVVATGAMSIVVGYIFRGRKSLPRLIMALCGGVVTMTVVMVGMNLLIAPRFFGVTVEQVAATLVPVVIPFNLLKAGINSTVAFLLYKALEKFIHKIL